MYAPARLKSRALRYRVLSRPEEISIFPTMTPWFDATCREGASLQALTDWESEGGALPMLSVYPCLDAPSTTLERLELPWEARG